MFEATVKITDQQIASTLCSAFEGGSNYWIVNISAGKEPTTAPPEGEDASWLFWWPLLGGSVKIEEYDPHSGSGHYVLTRKLIENGLQLMASAQPFRLNDMATDNSDAETGDVLLQFCLFGEIVYG